MLDTSKRVVIVGLGLLGGRYALGLTRAGFAVDGIDRSPEAVEFALKEGYIQRGATENFAPLLAEAGYVVLGLYPTALLEDAGAVAKSWPTFFEDMARGLSTRWQAREE